MRHSLILLCLGSLLFLIPSACRHEPLFVEDDIVPIDTTSNPVDTQIIDTTVVDTTLMLMPCDSEKVYFDLQILPILQSNCAFSGCHDAASAEDGVILDSYENVVATADVEPFQIDDSEIFEVLIDPDEGERMPPAPTDRLPADQIQLIATWILQGGEKLECDPNAQGCDTISISFAQFVEPTIRTHCQGCHSGAVPSGGVNLTNYENIKAHALNGRLLGAIGWENGFSPMPRDLEPLPDCTIDKIEAWVQQGSLNN